MSAIFNPLALMTLHTSALYRHDANGRILTINEPDGGNPAPRFFLGRTSVGNIWRFRADLSEGLVSELAILCQAEPVGVALHNPPRHMDAYMQLLGMHTPVGNVWMGPAYHFAQIQQPSRQLLAITEANAVCLQGRFEEFISELPTWQPFFGLVEDNQVVAICRSVRITADAHEAGVETLPEFRGRGYATAVISAWAHAVQALGAIPLYSTSWENLASQAVAKKLKLIQFGVDFHIA
ncbi:MAG: GNAT family N-acetyltransferase [Chloroflexota bacterium]